MKDRKWGAERVVPERASVCKFPDVVDGRKEKGMRSRLSNLISNSSKFSTEEIMRCNAVLLFSLLANAIAARLKSTSLITSFRLRRLGRWIEKSQGM